MAGEAAPRAGGNRGGPRSDRYLGSWACWGETIMPSPFKAMLVAGFAAALALAAPVHAQDSAGISDAGRNPEDFFGLPTG